VWVAIAKLISKQYHQMSFVRLVELIGLIFYQLWVVSLQLVLFVRGWAFAVTDFSRKGFSIIRGLFFALQWGFRFYSVAKIEVLSKPGEFCKTTQVGFSTSLPNFIMLIITYVFLLIPFLYRAMTTFVEARKRTSYAFKWLQSSIAYDHHHLHHPDRVLCTIHSSNHSQRAIWNSSQCSQFPGNQFGFFSDIGSQGYKGKEIYHDTFGHDSYF
jgi:hypothetical protein